MFEGFSPILPYKGLSSSVRFLGCHAHTVLSTDFQWCLSLFNFHFKSGYCEGHGKTFSPAFLEVVHHGFWGVFIIIITSAFFFVLWNVPCATGCNTTPKHDWSNSWTDVFFMKFSALCSLDIPLLILAKKFYFNLTGPQDQSKMYQACLNVLLQYSDAEFCSEDAEEDFFWWLIHENHIGAGVTEQLNSIPHL